MPENEADQDRCARRLVVVGGGFAGVEVVKGLRKAGYGITLIDRRNHHLFQPLLYQVATAALSPAQIATPIRRIFAGRSDVDVVLDEVLGVDVANRVVRCAQGDIAYDVLVLAAGATHTYFGRDDWAPLAPGLKTVDDAIEVRRRFLLAFERADRRRDPRLRAADMTFVVVGAGPTGVEMAGAMVEIAFKTLPREFRHVDTHKARVVLIEAMDRVLPTFPPELSARALRDLTAMGVEVVLSSRVTAVDAGGVEIRPAAGGAPERIAAHQVVWAAGVLASPIARGMPAELDKAGRVVVGPDLTIPGHPEVFVLGDMARVGDGKGGMVPGVCPAAMQMGRYAAGVLRAEMRALRAGREPPARRPFAYVDKGMLATIGRARAVASVFGRGFSGFVAWVLWAVVHIVYLITFRNRLLVLLDWAWAYAFFQRGARLITGEGQSGTSRDERR